jgi:alanine dehydrogenase
MMQEENNPFKELAREALAQPQEKLQKKGKQHKSLKIGIPKEITLQEKRIPLSPLSVQLLVNNGHEVSIESGAGKDANFEDHHYSEAGAKIAYDPQSIYSQSDILLKVDPPTQEEIIWMKPGQLLISALQLASLKEGYLKLLLKKKITAIAYEFYRDEAGTLPIIRAMSEIAGRASVLIAAEYLTNNQFGKGELLGGIPGIQPTKIVIIGAGAVGEYATRAAIGLGAYVQVFDNSLFKLRRLENNLGQRIYSSTILPHILAKSLADCDVAIGALRSSGVRSPNVVSEAMVQSMRPKSLIIDVSIDQGGCFETSRVTSHQNPVFEEHGVLHYCVPNIPSRVSRTASYALSNIFTPMLLDMGVERGFNEYIWAHRQIREGIYIYKGNLTNAQLGERFQMNHKEIDFLIAGNI